MRERDLTTIIGVSVTPRRLSRALRRDWQIRRNYEHADPESLGLRSRYLKRVARMNVIGLRELFVGDVAQQKTPVHAM